MNLKLKPKKYVKYQLADNALESVKLNIRKSNPPVSEYLRKYKNQASVIVNEVEKTMYFTVPFHHKGKMQWGEMYLLPILYFNLSIDFLSISENIVEFFDSRNKNDRNQMIQIPDEYYNAIISYRISSIIFLHTAIDATINYIIPDNFKYFSKRRKKEINKKEIEDLEFMDKVKEIFRALFDYDICNDKIYNIIDEINKHRVNFIHLNTTKDAKQAEGFFNELGLSLNIDIKGYTLAVIDLFKKFKSELFETFESTNHSMIKPNKDGDLSFYHPVINMMNKEDFVVKKREGIFSKILNSNKK